ARAVDELLSHGRLRAEQHGGAAGAGRRALPARARAGAGARMKRKAAPTIRDVAQAAGVSLGTASRALNRSGSVSPQATAAVARAARQLGYVPDAIAQS